VIKRLTSANALNGSWIGADPCVRPYPAAGASPQPHYSFAREFELTYLLTFSSLLCYYAIDYMW
jgi:hypothetical protein